MFSYLRRDIYHCPITIINIVRTKGKGSWTRNWYYWCDKFCLSNRSR